MTTPSETMTSPLKAIHRLLLPESSTINQRIKNAFFHAEENGMVNRSHYFGGRFENLYVDHDSIPDLALVLRHIVESAAALLNIDSARLRAGFWFNKMEPGHSTLLHSHDDSGELAAAVYYIEIPAHSGDLLLHQDDSRVRISATEGLAVLFPPDMPHEVTQHMGQGTRLSLAVNIGLLED